MLRRVGLVAAILLALGVVTTGPAAALFGFDDYIWRDNTCGTRSDPINVYMSGNQIGPQAAAVNDFQTKMGWNDSFGSNQWFIDNRACDVNFAQRADGCLACIRNHARFNGPSVNDPFIGPVTAVPAHHEILAAACGFQHASDSYNSARDKIQDKYNPDLSYTVIHSWAGNVGMIRQCDGSFVASDGYIYRITKP